MSFLRDGCSRPSAGSRVQRAGQRPSLIYIENEFDVPVIAGVVENTQERFLNIGFAARHDAREAALKAWTEALTLQEGSRDLNDPNGLLRQAIARHEFYGGSIKPWRADRAYLNSYRNDFHDVNDLMCHQQIFLDPKAIETVRPLLTRKQTISLKDIPKLPERSLAVYRHIVERKGYEIFYTDITTSDVAITGLRVVRVIIPGLVANFPAAFPYLGKRRILNAPVSLGWQQAPLHENQLNYFPLPHA